MSNVLGRSLISQSLSRRGDRFYERLFKTTPWMLLWIGAVVIGVVAGEAKWFYLIAIAAFPLAALWPVPTALGMFAVLVPFDAIAIVGGGESGTTLTWFVGVAAALVLFLAGLASGRIHFPPRATVWWSLFVLWCAVTCLWAIDPAVALRRMPTAGALLALYLLSASLRLTSNERLWIVRLSVLGGCLAAAYITREFYQGISFGSDSGPAARASLVLGDQEADPNGMAAGLLLPISLAMALFFLSQKWIGKAMAMLAVSLMGFCLFLTMSRGGALALVVIAAVYLRRLNKWRALVPVALLPLLLVFVPETFFHRFGQAAATGGAGRIPIWIAGLEMLKHYWLLGAGINNFSVAYSSYAGFAPVFKGYGRAAHNIYLGTWVELGMVGIALLLLAVRSQFRDVARARVEFDPIFVGSEAACWAILVAGFFLDVLWRKYFWLSWILLTISTQIWRATQTPVES